MSNEDKTAETGGPAWPMWILSVLMLIATGVGVYMTQHHEVLLYGGADAQFELAGCAEAEGVSCDAVNTSDWSELFGVPLFTWAIPTYLLIGGLAVLIARGRREFLPVVLVSGVGATLFSVFLYYISVVEIGSVCLWCMRLYGINFAMLVLALIAGAHRELADLKFPALGQAGAAFAGLTLVAVGAQKVYRADLLSSAGGTALAALEASATPEEADAGPFKDPEGVLPALSFDVTTEDGNAAKLTLEANDAWKGNLNATVAVVEYADLECGYCKRASGQLRRLYDAYGDRVLFVFKHFPMDPTCNPSVKNKRHRNACNASSASVCAQEQGRFWAFHDLAFKNQHQLGIDDLATYAEAVDLDMAAFNQCVRRPETAAIVKADAASGGALDIHGTPRIFINGKLYRSGHSAEQMAHAIEVALGSSGQEAAARAQALPGTELAPIRPIPQDVPEMQTVRYGDLAFQIDTFESGLADGKALTGKHVVPATRMSWFAASDACESVGKRMCSEEEWLAACQGARPVDDDGNGAFADDLIEGNAYPYGDFHAPGRCWDGKNRESFRPVYTGEMPGCVSRDGVYDLTGNMEEWVGTDAASAVLLGGAYDTSKDHARCYRRNDTFGAGYANQRTGFRCCKSL